MKLVYKFWKNNRSLIVFIALMSVFRSAVADWYEVPTGSMKPTIQEGDRILTDKMAYDIRVPFTHIKLLKLADPQAGDIIVFDSQAADNRLIKRVIGVPRDTVALENNELIINGKKLNYADQRSNIDSLDKIEDLNGLAHSIRVANIPSRLSGFDAITIPDDYYLAMGDNRDNSADSRVIGLIPRNELLGKAERVIVSLDYDNYYLPRKDRVLKKLN
ncbi:signal peptidase I [Pseudoalteromonas sp. APC 3691]|uniref:signal peptidase I n=1 Tax=Pseudoalteromonas sp. APC 3691 TaxID=3035173 RepID=UPI0025B41208|nr:signal peptidase I [Pseudoalteromonas sp. APC 3691]MDN3392099.1 signal peptidase I [Pseudoalteromonas sp. APC 3691]